jgi:hypothetical protein
MAEHIAKPAPGASVRLAPVVLIGSRGPGASGGS